MAINRIKIPRRNVTISSEPYWNSGSRQKANNSKKARQLRNSNAKPSRNHAKRVQQLRQNLGRLGQQLTKAGIDFNKQYPTKTIKQRQLRERQITSLAKKVVGVEKAIIREEILARKKREKAQIKK